MARYWVGGTGNWSDNTNHWAATSGGAPGASLPGSTDDVFFDAASHTTDYTVTIDATTKLSRDVSISAPASGNATFTSNNDWTVSGSFARYASVVWSWTGRITFNATSGTKTITSNGGAWRNRFSFNGSGGTFQLVDELRFDSLNSQSLVQMDLTAGTFDPNGQRVYVDAVNATTILTGFNFADFKLVGAASKIRTLDLSGNITCSGTFEVAGNSGVNRSFIRSSVRGTSRTITAATVTLSNVDLQDITGAGAGSWNLSAITGLSGDCGGNSGITFTTPVTNFWVGGTGNWDAVAEWASTTGGSASSGRVPLPQDTARFDASSFSAGSQTCTQNMTRIGSVDWTGVTNTPTWTTNTACAFFGSITLVSGMTLTGSSQAYTYEGRGASTLTSDGKSWAKTFTVNCVGGSLTLGDAFTDTAALTLTSGTLADGGFSVAVPNFVGTGSATRAVTLDGTWTLSGDIASIWSVASTGFTLTMTSGTIRLTSALTAARTFAGGGVTTYRRLENATTGAFALQFTGSNTFSDGIYVDASAAARTILFTAGTTTTVATFGRLDATTNVITIGSITAASHTLTKTGGGTITMDYMGISRSTATPGSTWYATHSTDSGNNSGWTFAQSMTASAGSFTVTGQSVNLNLTYYLALGAGSFTVNGQAVNLNVAQAANTITAEAGAIVVTGQAVNFTIYTTMGVSPGVFTVVGQDVRFVVGRDSIQVEGIAFAKPGTLTPEFATPGAVSVSLDTPGASGAAWENL